MQPNVRFWRTIAILCTTTFYAKQILRSTYTAHSCVLHGSQIKKKVIFINSTNWLWRIKTKHASQTQLYLKKNISLCSDMFRFVLNHQTFIKTLKTQPLFKVIFLKNIITLTFCSICEYFLFSNSLPVLPGWKYIIVKTKALNWYE